MSIINFECDYTEGAHPRILERLIATNLEQTSGYGNDPYCAAAREKIKAACGTPDADVHFLVGGTQTNTTVLSAILRPYQGAISADEGHIAVHETGSVEATGHKVITLPSADGKIRAGQVKALVEAHWADATHEHQPQPALVYISQPTENGTVYSLAELEAISAVCREKAAEHLKNLGPVVYLKVPLEELSGRIQNLSTRGIAMQPGQTLADVMAYRAPLYDKYADLVIDCGGGQTLAQTARLVLERLRELSR